MQVESLRCCNQKKTQWKYWTQWTFNPSKNAKIKTKTHEMDVLEALEDETLESHNSVLPEAIASLLCRLPE